MGGILLAGVPVCFGLSLYFASPISRLRKGTEAIGKGDFTHRVKIRRNDELGDLGNAFNQMSAGLSEREFIRETFGKYVAPEIRDEILAGRITLDGEKGVATLLFSDLRNFTPYVENNTPEEVVKSLRLYFTAMQRIITDHGGFVLQYVGDEIEAVFGLPVKVENHAEQAVRAALEMREALIKLNQDRLSQKLEPFLHGIGIHTGEVLAGNSGSVDRLAYTMIGESVNLASRIQGLTKTVGCDILINEDTANQLRGTYQMAKEEPYMVKGYSKPITVYQVLGAQES
jgi:class 3 adenylate cyclase